MPKSSCNPLEKLLFNCSNFDSAQDMAYEKIKQHITKLLIEGLDLQYWHLKLMRLIFE
jgi:hypothetical protein